MTVKIREWKKGKRMGFEVDIRFSYPDGTPYRRRIKAPVESKSAAKRWGEAKERELLMQPSPVFLQRREEERKEVPKVREFGPRFVENYDFGEYERLRQAARALGTRYECALLLGADAGLRGGEIIALRWEDVDFARRHITVQQQMWRRVIDTPKSGRGRILPMTAALIEALRHHKRSAHPRWVFTNPAGQPPSYRTLRLWLLRVYGHGGAAGKGGGTHVLRHTFCSHLAMRGAPAKAIQELAGHIHLSTTQRYMHLSPQAREGAIALLDERPTGDIFGEILETGS